MRTFTLTAGALALAIAGTAVAGPGGGKGGGPGGGNGNGNPHQGGGGNPHQGGGGPPGGGGGNGKGGGPGGAGGGGPKMERGNSDGRGPGPTALPNGNGGGPRMDRGGGRPAPANRHVEQQQRKVERQAARQERGNGRSIEVARQDRARRDDGIRPVAVQNGYVDNRGPAIATGYGQRGLVDGCPPGLAAKNNGCAPPGQIKRLVGAALPAAIGSSLLPPLYRNWYPDTPDYYYRSEDGYLVRVARDDNRVDGILPLSDDYGYYPIGYRYPSDYNFYNVPSQYAQYYPADGGQYDYRYGDGAIYQVDRSNGLIDGIVQLLAGDLAVGNPLPVGYDTYNVPLAYRDRYPDQDDAWYRYNDGYIYQVDPKTRLIQAVIQALV